MKGQIIVLLKNGMKIVIDKNSDPRNVRLFNEVLRGDK